MGEIICVLVVGIENKVQCPMSKREMDNSSGSISLLFAPEELAADLETGIHKGARSVWGTSMKILGGRFHLSRAWWPKIQSL